MKPVLWCTEEGEGISIRSYKHPICYVVPIANLDNLLIKHITVKINLKLKAILHGVKFQWYEY